MGTQQLILLVLGVIIIGISIAIGIAMFNNHLVKSSRMAVIGDLTALASVAASYYKTPDDMGGGAGTWDVDLLGPNLGYIYNPSTNSIFTVNGIYTFSSSGDILTILGTGTEIGSNDSTNVQVSITLTGESSELTTTVIN